MKRTVVKERKTQKSRQEGRKFESGRRREEKVIEGDDDDLQEKGVERQCTVRTTGTLVRQANTTGIQVTFLFCFRSRLTWGRRFLLSKRRGHN